MTEQKPTIVLVHGAFAESASWNGVIEKLQAMSLDCVAVANPLRSLTGDAAYVRDVIAGIGKPVVLVGHSYAGLVITEAAARNDAVTALVYVCAFCPDHGENAFGLSMKFPGSTLGDALIAYPVSTGGNEFAIRQDVYHQQFCADVPAVQAAVMAATQRPATEAALTEGLPAAGIAVIAVALPRTARRSGSTAAARFALVAGLAAAVISALQFGVGLALTATSAPGPAHLLFTSVDRLDGVKMLALAVVGAAAATMTALPRWLRWTGIALAVAITCSGVVYLLLIAPLTAAAGPALVLLLAFMTGCGIVTGMTAGRRDR